MEILSRLGSLFSPTRVGDYLAQDLIPDLVVAAITLTAFWLLWRVIRRALLAVLGRTTLDETAQRFVETVVRYTLMSIGVITALGQLGIDTTSILTSLGVVGLTIGFAAKDTLSNVISGLFIFWDRPFVLGDLVEISGQYGRVAEITMRSTRVVTMDGRMLAIPNTQIVNSTVASYTNFPHLRLEVDVTVAVTEDLARTREILLELVADHPSFMKDPAPAVVTTALNDYNVALQLRAWIENERDHVAARFDLRERMFEALREAGVEMPYETLALAPVTVNPAVDRKVG